MSYILFLLGLPHILEARRACLHSQLARLEDPDGKEAAEILGQLAELFELIKQLGCGKNAPFGASIPHDSLALYASGQDVAYKCSSPQCPGFPWPTSVKRHDCVSMEPGGTLGSGDGHNKDVRAEPSSPAAAKASEPSSPAGESHWPYPKTYEELRAQLLVAADEDTTYEIGAAELIKLLDEGHQESTEAHARLAALLGVDVKDVGLGDLVDMVRPQVVADKDWYKEHYQVEVADG